jgi:hypothetical protein
MRKVSILILFAVFTVSWAGAQVIPGLQKTPGHPRLDNRLNAVAGAFGQSGAAGAQATAQAHGLTARTSGRIAVILEPNGGLGASSIDLDEVVRRGGQVDAVSRSFMRVLVPYGSLRSLAGHPDVKIARVATPAVESSMGSNVSESVGLTGAGGIQLSGVTGAGVRVAVVDLGFAGLSDAIAAGELPGGTIAVDFSGTGIEADTAHGVGVAEHLMDMAHDVDLYCIKVSDEVDLQNAADYCRDNGISVANHSVGWVIASYYDGTGPINSIINDSRAIDGVFWAVAAGNDAQRHWRGGWSDNDNDDILAFSGGDERLGLTTTSSVGYVFLNWDQYGNSVTDLDLRVVDKRGRTVAASTGTQTGLQDPAEALAFTYNTKRDPYSIVVNVYSGSPAGLNMTVFSFYNDLEYADAASSMMDPANAPGAFTVAAIDQSDWGVSDAPESFSSQGPTNDGRPKPEITAPDGTTSWTYGNQASFGTSFSSPTVAGAAALLFSQDLTRNAGNVETLLSTMAEDVGDAGWDPVYGHGKLHLTSNSSNTAPVAIDDGPFDVTEDSSAATFDVLGNDSDGDVGDVLTVVSVTGAANGQTAIVGGGSSVSYVPNADFSGADSFQYTISDGHGGSATASVAMTVTPVNDAPTADDQAVETEQDTSIDITLTGSDPEGDTLGFTVLSGPAHGALSGTTPGLTYAPDPGYTGDDSFTFEVADGNGGTDTGTVTISITPPPPASVITLAVQLLQRRNGINAKLTWSGANSIDVDIYRDGDLIATKSNNGKYTNRNAPQGTYSYQVCEAGSLVACSNMVEVTIN